MRNVIIAVAIPVVAKYSGGAPFLFFAVMMVVHLCSTFRVSRDQGRYA